MPSLPPAAQPINNYVFSNKVNKYCHCDQICKTATKEMKILQIRDAEEQCLAICYFRAMRLDCSMTAERGLDPSTAGGFLNVFKILR